MLNKKRIPYHKILNTLILVLFAIWAVSVNIEHFKNLLDAEQPAVIPPKTEPNPTLFIAFEDMASHTYPLIVSNRTAQSQLIAELKSASSRPIYMADCTDTPAPFENADVKVIACADMAHNLTPLLVIVPNIENLQNDRIIAIARKLKLKPQIKYIGEQI
ncbi:MAG: hypothetical protein J6X42_00195 [Alphaproteobacteria bacterium]|nr:hypothetical protein [Alphaproteobacteria bacterium]